MPDCEQCGSREARPRRRYCNHCYRVGVIAPPIVVKRRPKNLVDTGMRIIEPVSILVHPDGRDEAVPPDFIDRFWFEPIAGTRELRVLRVGPEDPK